MADLIEYVRWRGDLSFLERPFNDVDNLVFSQIVYHSYDGIVPGPESRKKIGLKEAVKRNLEHPDAAEFPGLDQERNDEFLRTAADTERFGRVRLSDYVNVIRNEPDGRRTQFCALLYHLPDGSKYLAFRGTDNTIVGWREDFMISYTDTEAQHQALAYTRRMMKKYRSVGTVWRIGGHSKGGNLAVYSFAGLEQKLQERICALYSNDGPEFDAAVFGRLDQDARERMMSRYHKFVTTHDVIGMLFEEQEVRHSPQEYPWIKIVASSAKGLMQHWMLTWQVLPDRFDTRDRMDHGAKVAGDILEQWLSSASLEERREFVATVFDAIEKQGPHVEDAVRNGRKTLMSVIGEIFLGDNRTQWMIGKLLACLGSKSTCQIGCTVSGAVDLALESAKRGALQLNMARQRRKRTKRSVLS